MMEGIVSGIANINFQSYLVEFQEENRISKNIPMASPAENFPLSHEKPSGSMHDTSSGSGDTSDMFVDENSWEAADDDDDNNDDGASNEDTSKYKGFTFSERRQLPSRVSKDKSLLGSKRRTIMKPIKHVSSVHKDFHSMKPSEIKRLYMNKKLTKFRPSSLETIIEESSNSQSNNDEEDSNSKILFLGTRKYRRAVTFNDCFFVNKSLIKKRRAKIKKVIGRRPALKKISLEEFMDKLNSSMEEKQTTHTASVDTDKGYCHTEISLGNNQESIISSLAPAHAGEEKMELPNTAKQEVV